ncbi:unnamed protein product, partial [Vitis vinifera]|uniref:Uncharacterized protein n=1 Tax=Vitis vinifera TaxID=29760 RepID=D7SPU2_VITVI
MCRYISAIDTRFVAARNREKETPLFLAALHAGEYFDLSLLIIHLYEDLVNYVDEKGLTPLHVLAGKPTAFRSGTHLHFIERLIYQCKSQGITQEQNRIAQKKFPFGST